MNKYQKALDAQSATNMLALSKTLYEIAHENYVCNKSTKALELDPSIRLILEQLLLLSKLEYSEAYSICSSKIETNLID